MTLPTILMAVVLGLLALLGAINLTHGIRRRLRYRRVRRVLHEVQRQAYRERPQRGVSRSVWEGGDDAA